jgi:YcxB-like protein
MSSTSKTAFHYVYESTREEFVEGTLALFSREIIERSEWRPSIPLLIAGGIGGAIASTVASTGYAKVVWLLVPIVFTLLLTVSSKQSRIDAERNRIAAALSKSYERKKCQLHDLKLDENGFVESCPCGTDIRNWDAVQEWHETENIIVLQTKNRTGYAIPKRVIPAEELAPLRALVSRHVRAADLEDELKLGG